jgi:hypothetical protein
VIRAKGNMEHLGTWIPAKRQPSIVVESTDG